MPIRWIERLRLFSDTWIYEALLFALTRCIIGRLRAVIVVSLSCAFRVQNVY